MTTFIDKDKWVEYAVPTVFKAMKLCRARELIETGTVCFTNIETFANDPDPERGDINEGKASHVRNGRKCTTGYAGPVYVWCCTMDANPCRVMKTWPDRDCVIQVCNTYEFASRVACSLRQQCRDFGPLALGPVVYTKTAGGYEHTNWADGLFQKDQEYDNQREFRFALTGYLGTEKKEKILLHLGPCDGIVRIALHLGPCNDIVRIARPTDEGSDGQTR